MSMRLPGIPWFARRGIRARSRQVFQVLTRRGLGFLLDRIQDQVISRRGLQASGHEQARNQAEQLRMAFIELGATFIKVGQALSARYDLLPPEYTTELSKLQDEVPPLPFNALRGVIEGELGDSVEHLFAQFNPEPLASASIGQVYAAQLTDGSPVVVKVVRPGVEEQIEIDLEIIANMAEWASQHTALGHLYDLPALVDEFAYTLRSELNYIKEGRNADTFRRCFYKDERLYFPRVYWEFSTRRVLTLERLSGIKISDIDALDSAGINRRVVTENLMHLALKQIFQFNMYHADPHPGNFFVQPDGSLAVMDFGMVGRLSDQMKHILLEMAAAIQRHDVERMVDAMLSAGIYTRGIKRQSLGRDLGHLLDNFTGDAIQDLSLNRAGQDLMTIALEHGLQLPGELVAMLRAIMISEGTAKRIYPDFRLFHFAAPYVSLFWQAEHSPEVVLPRLAQSAVDGLNLTMELPRRLERLLGQVERGQMEININIEWLRGFMNQMQRMTNRLALSVLLAGIIVALGLVMVVYRPTEWEMLGDYIFGFAFVTSLAFGAWLMFSIWRSGK